MSLAVVSNLWMQIYSPEGILNTMLAQIGIEAQPFIYSADQALPSIAIMSVWQGVGYQMIIFLSKYEISGIGDKIDFVFNSSRIHFFDKNTEVCYV